LISIDFELDVKKVVNSFSSAHQDVTKFGTNIHNCKTIFKQYYINSSVEFVRRQASETSAFSTSFQILVEIRNYIKHVLTNEML